MITKAEGYADGYLISAIAKSTEIQDSLIAMIAEVSPAYAYRTFRYNNYSDSIPGNNLYTANNQIARNSMMNFCTRYNAIISAIGSGTNISSTESWELMRDYSNLEHNIQFMQYAPELDLFKISVYGNNSPAYQNEPVTYSISDLFGDYTGDADPIFSKSNISVFPNPVVNILTIHGLNQIDDDIVITIFDINGKEVFLDNRRRIDAEYKINLEPLTSGIYFVKAQIGETSHSVKIVKQ